ncbi:hypothetical protein [Pseudosporangium ferrugineum]|uniref:DUF4352 domain-containing protein n=1 Tax=Pseudosporangium ferrugineum TaxID=439699 RepID=A0A2T0RS64_9ACTN|nr:hypothetical protein [Pseudosporangium ferrugineum]PRY24045.1 hypothetical protein CLV70_114178 [Pseudosporangium ferrugineum]
MRSKTFTVGLAVLAVVALACGASPSLTEGGGAAGAAGKGTNVGPVAVKMGQKLTVDTGSLSATYTLSKAQVETRSEFGSEAENGAYLLAFLRVDVTKGETFACSCELSLVQKNGKVREPSFAGFDGKPEFESADLKAGQNTDGWVSWDLPPDEISGSKVQLKISSLFSDSEYGYWTVKS